MDVFEISMLGVVQVIEVVKPFGGRYEECATLFVSKGWPDYLLPRFPEVLIRRNLIQYDEVKELTSHGLYRLPTTKRYC